MLDRERVSEVLDQIRPSLQADGGDVELVDITDDGYVVVQLQGACHGCPMSSAFCATVSLRCKVCAAPTCRRISICRRSWAASPCRHAGRVAPGTSGRFSFFGAVDLSGAFGCKLGVAARVRLE